METEFRAEYNAMRKNTQEFATSLLDHARTSNELEIMLNFNPTGENWEPGERQTLERLKLAIKYKQKQVGFLRENVGPVLWNYCGLRFEENCFLQWNF